MNRSCGKGFAHHGPLLLHVARLDFAYASVSDGLLTLVRQWSHPASGSRLACRVFPFWSMGSVVCLFTYVSAHDYSGRNGRWGVRVAVGPRYLALRPARR